MNPRVVVIGDVIDDILVTPATDLRIDTDTRASIIQRPGGSAANFACWLASLGQAVDFVGRVARADLQRHNSVFNASGVTPHLQAEDNLPTGCIVVLVQGEHRSFLTERGANRALDAAGVTDELLASAGALYLSGYSLFESLSDEEVQRLIRRAKAAGLLVVVDPGSAGFIADYGVAKFLKTLEGTDVFLPSLEEGRVLTGESVPEVIAAALAERFGLVALTVGAAGCVIAGKYASESLAPTQVPTAKADAVDPTGAGDAFAAGFVHNLLLGKGPIQAAAAATRLASRSITISGGRPSPELR